MTTGALLRAEGIRSPYLAGGQRLLDLTLRPGEIVQVLGPSGCGKSTFLRILARLEAAQQGRLWLGDTPSAAIPAPAWRRQVVHLSQRPTLFPGTVQQNMLAGFATSNAGPTPPDLLQHGVALLQQLGLGQTRLDQDARTLSGGEAARLTLVRALLIEPPVLLADEPTAPLDQATAAKVVALLARRSDPSSAANVQRDARRPTALVVVAHDLSTWADVPSRPIDLSNNINKLNSSSPAPEAPCPR